jgi:PAS domain S-box-containing protein
MMGEQAEGHRRDDALSRWKVLLRLHGPVDTLLQAIADAVIVADPQGNVIYCNDRAAELCGCATREELMTRARATLARFDMCDERGEPYPHDDLPSAIAFRTGRPAEVVMRYRNRDTGIAGVSRIAARPVFDDEGGSPVLVMSIIRDITAERDRQDLDRFVGEVAALLGSSLDSEASLATLAVKAISRLGDACAIHLLGEGDVLRRVAVAHAGERLALVNALAEHSVDPTVGDCLERAIASGRSVLEEWDDAGPPGARSLAHTAPLAALGVRSALVVPLASRARVLGAITLLNGVGRRFTRADVALAEEVARRTAMFVENARLFAAAQRAVRVRDDFLAVASHDLQSPLGAVLLSASVLAREGTDERMRQYAKSILRAAERMDRLIHDLLDLAAIDAGQLSIDRQCYDACVLALDALELLEPVAEERTIHIRRELEAAIVVCDRGRVLQILSNLLDNAIKFTPAGGTIVVRCEARPGDVVFAVVDDGPGIDPRFLPHVFDRFWQGRKDKRRGIGLGLSIAKGLVEAQGGAMWVDSEVGRGTAFYFSLPRP